MAAARNQAARKSPPESTRESTRDSRRGADDHADDRTPLVVVVSTLCDQLATVLGRAVESVSAIERRDGGWLARAEVVELERIPASTSVLGSYEVEADGGGNVVGYERVRRYYRNQAGDA